jgi:hypothetical protein
MNNTELQTILDRLHELEAISLTTRTSAEQNELYDIVRLLRTGEPEEKPKEM